MLIMRPSGHLWLWLGTAALVAAVIFSGDGQPVMAQAGQLSPDGIWQTADERIIPGGTERRLIAGPHALVRLDRGAFEALVQRAPLEVEGARPLAQIVLSLPMPDGRFARFEIEESPILVPELAAAFPQIRTYRGQGLDDPAATTRFGWTDAGFHAIVLSADESVYIDPAAMGQTEVYVSYRKGDLRKTGAGFICLVDGSDVSPVMRTENTFPLSNGDTKRTYRLALAATGEYTAAAGGTKALALSRMTTTMNRVNGIYERDLAVRMTVATGTVGDPTALIYTDGTTDPYSNADGFAMLAENQANVDTIVGSANYDIGHVFSTGGGGVAYLRSPCNASLKAGGVTGSSNPTGDAFDVDYVAHEMGHQFGGNHTFNGTAGNCGTRSASHAYEVGSGSTIQAYAGICSVENLQPNSNDYFHVESLDEMTAFLTSGGGTTCGTTSATGNTPPTVSAGSNYTIPQQTPFMLTATGSDVNGDTLTYAWEQFDLGTASSSAATASTDDGSRPLFRSYSPTSSPSRSFPSLTYILNNANVPPATYACALGTCLTGETLPASNRTMTFQVTARDNRSGGGGVTTAHTLITSTTAAGPFAITSPNTAVNWAGGSVQTVTWNVAGTTASPVSTPNVKISLSTDGGSTFSTVLSASTPNDGTETVTIPASATNTARIKVEAVGNIFFDISDTNFTITAAASAPSVTTHPSDQAVASGSQATFTAAASGSPTPTVQWQQSTDGGTSWSNVSGATSTTHTFSVNTGDNGKRFRAVFTNASGTATTNGARLTVYGPAGVSPSPLLFGAIKAGAGSAILQQTPAQDVTVTFSGASSAWTAATTQTWLKITNGSGTTAGKFTVEIQNPSDVIGANTTMSGSVTLTAPTAPNSPVTIPVTLEIYRPGSSAAPFGAFDTPADATGLQGSFAVTGWALDDVAIDRVEIWRDLVAGETTPPYVGSGPGNGKVFIANPLFITGSRTDVEAAYPNFPQSNRSGWGYLLLSWGLWSQGNGTYTLYAFAFDKEGNYTTLGTKTIGVSNATATKPFGALDTPAYGDLVSGGFWNYGWALTPNATPPCTITNGNVLMGIDSRPLVAVNYGDLRTDIAASFPGFSNGNNSGGAYYIDTTQLENGRHQIGWLVTDNCARQDGIGSRFFTTLNGTTRPVPADQPAWLSRLAEARVTTLSADPVGVKHWGRDWEWIWPGAGGTRLIEVAQDGHIEVQLPTLTGAKYAGYQEANGVRTRLPEGSSLDTEQGVFYWQPAPGFLGRYDLTFGADTGPSSLVRARVIVGPPVNVVLERPRSGSVLSAPFSISGWATDISADNAPGVDDVQVWARPLSGGAEFWAGGGSVSEAGQGSGRFTVTVEAMPPGEYEILVSVRRTSTGIYQLGARLTLVIR